VPDISIPNDAPIVDHASPVATLDWPALESAVKACTKCALHKTRTHAVFGVGNRQAQWMVIGEAPGADEDAQGEPFVGRAGQLLNSMIKAVGLRREDVYIANILKSRPPNNRDPAPDEVSACMPYLHRQIELVNPKLLLCVGRIAAQNLLSTDTPIGKLRGQVHRLGHRPVVVTYHPAYLLRSPGEKRRAWQDLVLAMDTMATLPS
jgi:DNA polymerase